MLSAKARNADVGIFDVFRLGIKSVKTWQISPILFKINKFHHGRLS